jgi:hypothetical protein
MYRILHYLYTYSTGSRSRYKYSNVIPISQSYLSHMYHDCVSPSIFDEYYSIDCALHHAVKYLIVLSMRVKCYWLAIYNNTLGLIKAGGTSDRVLSDGWKLSPWSDVEWNRSTQHFWWRCDAMLYGPSLWIILLDGESLWSGCYGVMCLAGLNHIHNTLCQ